MSIIVDTLADIIRDSIVGADASVEDWERALLQVSGPDAPRLDDTPINTDTTTASEGHRPGTE